MLSYKGKKMHTLRLLTFLIVSTLLAWGTKAIVTPPWTPYELKTYTKTSYFDIRDTTLSYEVNQTKKNIKVNGQYWHFRYPSKSKESHQQVHQKIGSELEAKNAKLLFVDDERTLYVENDNNVRRYYDIYYGWRNEIRIYIYQEQLLSPEKPQEITFEKGQAKEQMFQATFDGEHYYYLIIDIIEGKGIDIEVSPDLEDEAVRIRYESKLRCDAKYYKRYSMYDLAPYKAIHYFKIKSLKGGDTKAKLTLVKTPYKVPSLNQISSKAGLLKMKNSLSSMPKVEPLGQILGEFSNEGDYLPNGDAIYWLNNGYYTLYKKNLQTNLVPIKANYQTAIDWPLFYEKLSSREAEKEEQVSTKMAIYEATPNKKGQVRVNLSLSHLPKDINLTKEDFKVVEAGTIEGRVVSLERLHQLMNIVILLDSSGSMKKSMKLALESVEAFIQKLPEDAEITLVDFDTKVKLIQAKNRKAILSKLKQIKANGATALYDSIIKGVDLLKDKSRASIVLFTDGKDANYNDTKRGSKATFDEMMAKVQSTHIPIYPIAFGDGADTTTLTTIANLTKTTYYQGEKKEQLTEIFNEIAQTLSSAYKLVYERGKVPKEGSQSMVNYMVDVSGSQDLRFSMRKKCEGCGYRYEQLKSMLASSIESLPKSSFVQLNSFSDKVKTLQIITRDKAKLLASIGAMDIGGGTAILDAVKQGFELSSVIPSNRRYFIFITDAAADAFEFDEEEQKELNAALLAFKQNGIQTFWLGMVESQKAKTEVEKLATVSGGEAFVSADIDKIRDKILRVTEKVGESNTTQVNTGSITVKLKRRNEASGEMVVAVGEKSVDFPLLQAKTASQKVSDISYQITPFDTNKESYNIANAQKIYGEDTPVKEVQLSKIIPLKDDNNQSVSGANRAVKINMHTAYLFDRLKGINARQKSRFLVLDLSLENLLKAQKVVVLEDGSKHPSGWLNKSNNSYKTIEAIPSYKIPNLKRHLFLRVNNQHEIPFESITWALEKPLVEVDEQQLLVEPKVKKEGVLAFVVPNEAIESLSLHLYDTAYGHLDIPIIGKLERSKEEVEKLPQTSFTKLGENFALKIQSEVLQEQIKETKAKEGAIFNILDITLESQVNALLKIDPTERIFLKIQSEKGDYIIPTHPITTALPMGLYENIALAPSSNNRFKVAFHIPKALKDNPSSLLVELKGEDVELPIKGNPLKQENSSLVSEKVEGITLDLHNVYETKRGEIAFDITLHDTKDGEATRLHEAIVMSKYKSVENFTTIVDKNQEIKAGGKGLGSFANQSELSGAYKWIAPNSASKDKIVGYDSSQVIYDGTSRRFVVLFDKNSVEKGKANYLISPIFKGLSYKVNTKKLKKLPKELDYLLTEKLAYKIEGDYDKQVAKVLKKLRATKIATKKSNSKLPVIGLDSPNQLAKVIDPLPISLYGAEKLAQINDIDSMVKALQAIEWVPASDSKAIYSVASMFTQGWGTEHEMLQALYQMVKTYNVPIVLGHYKLSEKGKERLAKQANGIPVTQMKVPFIEWGEVGSQKSVVIPFMQSIAELKEELTSESRSTISSINVGSAQIKMRLSYEKSNTSANMQVGGMANALGGGSKQKEKTVNILTKSFPLNHASDMPIDIWFTQGKNKKGDPVLFVYRNGTEGVEYDEVRLDPKIIPKKLEIELYNGYEKLDPLTFRFKEGQKVDEVFLTFAFASPELSEEALKVIEAKRKEAFDGVKEIAPFSKLQWANRAKIYKFVALQSKYENHLQETLKVNAKRHKTPRAIMAIMERTPDNKLVSSLDLRMVFNDVYGEKNVTNAFNIMSGIFNSKAEASVTAQGKGVFDYWKEYKNHNLVLIDIHNRKEIIKLMEKQKVKPSIISRLKSSKNVWIYPLDVDKDIAWLEVDKSNYTTVSVLENNLYGSATEYSIQDVLVAEGTGYMIGFFGGVMTSVTTVVSVNMIVEDYEKVLSLSEAIAGFIAVGIGVATGDTGADKLIALMGTVDGVAGRALGIGKGLTVSLSGHIRGKNPQGAFTKGVLGWANGFGDGVTFYFSMAKESKEK